MAYGNALQSLMAPKPPVGAPPAQPHIGPPPYDVVHDQAWTAMHPGLGGDHEFRNFLNNLSPEERQMLLQRMGQLQKVMAPGGGPPGVPPNSQVPLMAPRPV